MTVSIEQLREKFYPSPDFEYSSSDFVADMVVIRIELEKNQHPEKYKLLNLFCNWALHPKLSKSKVGLLIGFDFFSAVEAYDLTNSESFAIFSNNFLGQFLDEFNNFFIENKIFNPFLNSDNPLRLLCMLLLVIKERPIIFQKPINNKSSVELYNQLHRKVNAIWRKAPHHDTDVEPYKLQIEWHGSGHFNYELSFRQQGSEHSVTLNHPMVFKGKRINFKVEN